MSCNPPYLSGVWDFDGGTTQKLNKSKDQADKQKSEVNYINLSNFATLVMIKKLNKMSTETLIENTN